MAVMQLYGCRKTPTKKKLVLSCLLVTPGVPALICLALPSLILKTVNLSLYSSRVPQSSPLCVHVSSGYNQSNHESCPAYPTCPYYCFSKSPIVVLSAKHDICNSSQKLSCVAGCSDGKIGLLYRLSHLISFIKMNKSLFK